MSWFEPIIAALSFVWHLFLKWLGIIFVTPFQTWEMLWILIPIYLGWITAELFQEKRGTSLGNAISNGVVPLWAGVDWLRTTVNAVHDGVPFPPYNLYTRYFLAGLVVVYGLWIVFAGARGNDLIKRYGRIRVVTYIVILFTPVFYRAVPLDRDFVLATIMWFPLFYYIVEGIDRLVPDPKSILEDIGAARPRPIVPMQPRPAMPQARPQNPYPQAPASQNQWPPRTY